MGVLDKADYMLINEVTSRVLAQLLSYFKKRKRKYKYYFLVQLLMLNALSP